MRFAVVVGEQGKRVMGVTNVSERTRNVERCRQSFGELCYLQPADTFYWLINLLMWTFIAQPSGTAMEKERYANIGVWFKCRRATKSTLLLPNLIAEWRNENRRIERHWKWAKCSVSACSMFFSSLFFYLCAAAAGWMTDIFRWANSCLPFQFFFLFIRKLLAMRVDRNKGTWLYLIYRIRAIFIEDIFLLLAEFV